MGKEFVVGIDLGTTNSVISWVKPDKTTEVIQNAEGQRTTPSVVTFQKTGEIIVGEPAKRLQVMNSQRTVKSIKRKMGTDYTITIDDKIHNPQEISSFILRKLIKDAEQYLGGPIKKAVITCPAYFNDAQRQATKEAGEIAGLEVLRIINEPTAAALAYGLDKQKNEKVVVYDLGGGTFDVSVLEIGDGVIQVISTNGNNHLGGDDFDELIVHWLNSEFKKQYGIDLSTDNRALQRLYESGEKQKIELSTKMETDINLPFIANTQEGQLHLETKLTRSKLEQIVVELVEKTREPVKLALKDAQLKVEEINEVILVGGMTRMPIIQRIIKEIFGKDGNKSVNPDEAIAVGAQVQSQILGGDMGKDVVLIDVTPLTLGVEVQGGLLESIIVRNTTIPIKKSKIFTTAEDNQPEVQIKIYQGERPMASQNHLLGSFSLIGLLPAPRHVPQIEVTFDIDTDGIVHVTAKDLGTNKEQSMIVTGRNKLSTDEINKMIDEAQKNEEEDKKRKSEVELKNQAISQVYQVEKILKENGDKIPQEMRGTIEPIIHDLNEAITQENFQRIKLLNEQLTEQSLKIGEHIYKNVTPPPEQQEVQSQTVEQTVDEPRKDVNPEEQQANPQPS